MATRTQPQEQIGMQVFYSNAAAVDIGSTFHVACVGQSKEDVQTFGVTTAELERLCDWFAVCMIRYVLIESTGYYWRPLFKMLQSRKFDVWLVNAKHVRDTRGMKTDVNDATRLQKLLMLGLVKKSFQPEDHVMTLRTYTRNRRDLIRQKTRYINKMHKSLICMNIQISSALSDIDGLSGLNIITAILSGERNAKVLASLVDRRVKATQEDLIAALQGIWYPEYLYELKQSKDMYNKFDELIASCDEQILAQLQVCLAMQNEGSLPELPPDKKLTRVNDKKNKFDFSVGEWVARLTNEVDFLALPGMGNSTLLTIVSEIGWEKLDVKFETAKHFSSWLGLSPNVRKSGGKVLGSKTRPNSGFVAAAFRQCANCVGNMKQHPLHSFFHKKAHAKGRPFAIVATAHKLATIYYRMSVNGEEFNYESSEENEVKIREIQIRKIKNMMTKHNIDFTDIGGVAK